MAEQAQTVPLVSPLGGLEHVPAADVGRLVGVEGYRPASPEEVKAQQQHQEYGGFSGIAAATGLGALRGATVGLSDAALAALGQREPVAGYRAENPYASLLGEIGGGIAGVGKFGGGGLLARGARAITAPARAVEAAGAATQTAFGGGLLGAASRGLVEGGIYGLGAGVTDLSLSDDEATGERIATALGGHALYGALLGGGIGAGFGAIGKGGSLIKRGLLGPGEDGMEALARRQFGHVGEGVPSRLVRALDSAVSAATGAERGTFASLASRRNLRLAVGAGKIREQNVEEMTRLIERAIEADNSVAAEFMGGFKREQIAKKILVGNEADTFAASVGTLSAVNERLQKLAENPVQFAGGKWLTGKDGLLAVINNLWGNVDDAMQKGGPANLEMFMGADAVKRAIGSRAMKWANKGVHGMTPQEAASWTELKSIYEKDLLPFLEDTRLWGDAAKAQAAINPKWKALLDVKLGQGMMPAFDTMFTSKVADWNGAKWMVNRKKVAGFLDSITNPAEHDGLVTLNLWMDRLQDFVDTAKNHLDLDPKSAKLAGELEGLFGKLRNSRDTVVEAATAENQLRKLEEADAKGNLLASAIGYGLGSGILGPGGAIGLAALNVLTKPGATLRKAGVMLEILGGQEKRLGEAAGSLFKGATAAVGRAGVQAREAYAATNERNRKAEERMAQVSALMRNKDVAEQRAKAMFIPVLDTHPKAADAAVKRIMAGIDYLHRRMPPSLLDTHPLARKRPKSKADYEKWQRIVDAVDDPVGELAKGLKSGRLRPEVMDAIRETAPQVIDDLTVQIMDRVGEMREQGKTVPYKARLALGTLMGPMADPTLNPGVITMLQDIYAGELMKRPGMKSTDLKGDVPSLAEAYETEAQKMSRER